MASENKTERFEVRVSPAFLKRLDAEVRRQKLDRASLVRRILNHFLEDVEAQLDQEKGSDVQSLSEDDET